MFADLLFFVFFFNSSLIEFFNLTGVLLNLRLLTTGKRSRRTIPNFSFT
jgi:hypothetical protein